MLGCLKTVLVAGLTLASLVPLAVAQKVSIPHDLLCDTLPRAVEIPICLSVPCLRG